MSVTPPPEPSGARAHTPTGAPVRSTAVVYCEANFGGHRRQDRQRPGPPLREVRDPVGHRQREVRARRRRGARRQAERHPDLRRPRRRDRRRPGASPTSSSSAWRPSSGMLSPAERLVVLDAIAQGMNIVNGLHEFLNDDPEFAAAAAAARRHDPRRAPPARQEGPAHVQRPHRRRSRAPASRCSAPTAPSASAPRRRSSPRRSTTAGIRAVLVGTGQTGLIQGARYGVALDAIPCQFCSGEMEAAVVEAFEGEHPDVIIIEGQGALSHPAYLTSTFILRGSRPDARDPAARARAAASSATSPTCRCRRRRARSTSSRPSPTRRSSASRSTTST